MSDVDRAAWTIRGLRWSWIPTQLLLGLLICGTLAAQEPDVVVRVKAMPESAALVGQRIDVAIDVLAEGVWGNLAQVPSIDVPGAVVYTPPGSGVRLNETINGNSFIGQRYDVWVYPQRSGRLQIPSVQLDVQINAYGVKAEAKSQSASTDPISIDVTYPEGVSRSANVICVDGFSVKQSWQPQNADFRVGDGITRTITRTVEGAPAMLLSPMPFSDVAGMRSYRKQPQVDDAFNRGSLTGTRTESVTFVFEQAGEVELPKIEVAWWDMGSKRLRTEELAGQSFTVAAAAVVESETQEGVDPRPAFSWWLPLLAAMAAAVCALLWRFREPLTARYQNLLAMYRATEQAHFRRFQVAAKSDRSKETLNSLVQWWDVADAASRAPRLDEFVRRYGTEDLLRKITSLEAAIDSQEETWHAGALAEQVALARNAWRSSMRSAKESTNSCLPPLNS